MQVYSGPLTIGSLLIGGPWTKTRRVVVVAVVEMMLAESPLVSPGARVQLFGSSVSAVLSKVMSLPVPATRKPALSRLVVI